MIASRLSALLIAALAGCMVLQPWRVHAQWWSLAPADFEACADVAEKAPTKEEKTAALTRCNAKFAGRRKPGGGYTYYDFMQNRSFDIAGPNPTPAEQKYIDEQYTLFLDRERRNTIVQELAARQQQQESSSNNSSGSSCSRPPSRARLKRCRCRRCRPTGKRPRRPSRKRAPGPAPAPPGKPFPANGRGSPKESAT